MTRFGEGDYDDEYWMLAMGRWEANLKRAIRGRRGQRVLRELREALLALPERRLVKGDLATPEGEVCTVGALVAYKRARAEGLSITEAAKALAAEDPEVWEGYERNPETGEYEAVRVVGGIVTFRWSHGEDQGQEHTVNMGKRAGLVYTLAWHLGWQNDDEWGLLTPEQRWKRCFRWVEDHITAEAAG